MIENMLLDTMEFEIKLGFPQDRLKDIEAYLISNGGLRRQHLQAAYIDTPDFLLAHSGVALRLRKEGRRWVQTLKLSSANALARLEHNVLLPSVGSEMPQWDIALHKDHKAGKILIQTLGKSRMHDLQVMYRTDIWRRKALIQTSDACIEYALDVGFILANKTTGLEKIPVQELEIELKDGSPEEVLRHAEDAIKSFGANIDSRSKSERGSLLALGLASSPPERAKNTYLKKAKNKQEIVSQLMHSCLSQILSNQSVLSLSLNHYAEYLHQLRVGLRRLKVILKHLEKQDIHISEKGAATLNSVFDSLGQYRDDHYVLNVLNPILLSLGGPQINLGSATLLPHPSSIVKGVAFQLLLVELMLVSYPQLHYLDTPESNLDLRDGVGDIRRSMEKLLKKNFKFYSGQVAQFSALDDEDIHTLRKKMKFMRYTFEFFKDYFEKKNLSKINKSMVSALGHFGLFNDICVAINRIKDLAESEPNLLFALGWLKGERARIKILCHKSAKKLSREMRAWNL